MEFNLSVKNRIYLGLIVLLLLVNFFAYKEVIFLNGPHYLKVQVLDIGQGDSIFIETPQLRHIIIDGGPSSVILEKLAKNLPFWEKSLDAIVLTHPDADHLMGLLAVLKKYHVDYIIWTGMVRDGANYQEWLSLLDKAKKQGSQVIIAKEGMHVLSGGADLTVLHPFENIEGHFFKEGNDTGVVSRLVYGQRSFLFTADISSAVEQALVDKKVAIASDILKVAHHGSKYSSSEIFLKAASPSLAVISVGANNTYGHPTPEVLQRLQNLGISIVRTDEYGDVKFLSDGQYIQLMKN